MLLVFNSLDVLHSHFPLCAEHSIFVPALVELLCLEDVTSFFVATSDRVVRPERRTGPGGAGSLRIESVSDPYGLISMADPVLRFARIAVDEHFPFDRVFGRKRNETGESESIVQMTIERFAAGTCAGARVYFTLEDGVLRDLSA